MSRADRAGRPGPALLAVAADAVADRRIGLVDYEIHGVAASYDPAGIRCCPSYLPTRRYRLDRDRLLTMLGRKQWIHALHLSSHGIVLDPSRPASVALLLHGSDDTPRALTAHEIASHLQRSSTWW